jgi:ABC-type branched-subunit amino acid transport system ATPase component
MKPTLLELRGLRRRFGGVVALDGLDVTVAEGTITALIGPNGAGKTTAFQCISGVDRKSVV